MIEHVESSFLVKPKRRPPFDVVAFLFHANMLHRDNVRTGQKALKALGHKLTLKEMLAHIAVAERQRNPGV